MTRTFARSPRGERVHDEVPRNRGQVTTILGALTVEGLVAVMTIEGGTDTAVFETYVRQFLLPRLRPGDTVVLDNLGAHKTPSVRALIESVGASVLFLPPYSPELNPIEECWSKVKSVLRSYGARTLETLDDAIAWAMHKVSPADALGWIRHAGYAC